MMRKEMQKLRKVRPPSPPRASFAAKLGRLARLGMDRPASVHFILVCKLQIHAFRLPPSSDVLSVVQPSLKP